MGVKCIFQFLRNKHNLYGNNFYLLDKNFEKSRILIDISCILYKIKYNIVKNYESDNEKIYQEKLYDKMLDFINKIKKNNLDVIIVFDGKFPQEKSQETNKRIQNKNKINNKK